MTSHPSPDLTPTLIHWAEEREPVRAVLLTSTRAIPVADIDVLSDYDVILVVEDIQPFVDDRSWLEDFGKVLVVYWDPVRPDPVFGIEQCGNVTQYEDGLKIDFTLWPVKMFEQVAAAPALLPELDAGYRILLDKDNRTASLPPPAFKAFIPRPPSRAEYQALVNDFLSNAPYVAKFLWRDELLPAKWCLGYDMKHIYLRQLLEWRMEIDHSWSVPARILGKGLEKRLPPDTLEKLEQSFAGEKSTKTGRPWQIRSSCSGRSQSRSAPTWDMPTPMISTRELSGTWNISAGWNIRKASLLS